MPTARSSAQLQLAGVQMCD